MEYETMIGGEAHREDTGEDFAQCDLHGARKRRNVE